MTILIGLSESNSRFIQSLRPPAPTPPQKLGLGVDGCVEGWGGVPPAVPGQVTSQPGDAVQPVQPAPSGSPSPAFRLQTSKPSPKQQQLQPQPPLPVYSTRRIVLRPPPLDPTLRCLVYERGPCRNRPALTCWCRVSRCAGGVHELTVRSHHHTAGLSTACSPQCATASDCCPTRLRSSGFFRTVEEDVLHWNHCLNCTSSFLHSRRTVQAADIHRHNMPPPTHPRTFSEAICGQ